MNDSKLKIETDVIRTHVSDSLAILEVKKDAFSMMTEIREGFTILNWYKDIKNNNSIKGVLLFGKSNLLSETPYKRFLSNISEKGLEELELQNLDSLNTTERKKQINMLNNFTRNILEFPKMIISFLDGCVVTPFIGSILATDMKLATKQTTFSFLHKKFGLHPTGALPFFLTACIGFTRAKNLLYTKDELNAEELLSLGLIDEIISPKNIDEVIEYAKTVVEKNSETFKTTKELANKIFYDQYQSFMELESQMVA